MHDATAIERIRSLVNEGEVALAVEQLRSLLRAIDSDLHNETVLHSARLVEIGRRERRGLLSPSDAAVQRNQVTFAVLDMLQDVAHQLEGQPGPIATAPVAFEIPDEVGLEKIFGTNNLKSIAWLSRGLQVARSVCRVVTPKGIGSGFLIEGGRLLTNHHVISSSEIAERSHIELGYEENAYGAVQSAVSYPLEPSSLRTSSTLDYAWITIHQSAEQPSIESWGSLRLTQHSEPRAGDHVVIIQHPQGGPKQIALTANQVVNVYEYRLQYTTDTLPGSSGSPVFNDDWQVIAIHHAGGNLISNSRGDRRFVIQGILLSYILKDLTSD
jgi:V8-like Glu-specific endopeptidase